MVSPGRKSNTDQSERHFLFVRKRACLTDSQVYSTINPMEVKQQPTKCHFHTSMKVAATHINGSKGLTFERLVVAQSNYFERSELSWLHRDTALPWGEMKRGKSRITKRIIDYQF